MYAVADSLSTDSTCGGVEHADEPTDSVRASDNPSELRVSSCEYIPQITGPELRARTLARSPSPGRPRALHCYPSIVLVHAVAYAPPQTAAIGGGRQRRTLFRISPRTDLMGKRKRQQGPAVAAGDVYEVPQRSQASKASGHRPAAPARPYLLEPPAVAVPVAGPSGTSQGHALDQPDWEPEPADGPNFDLDLGPTDQPDGLPAPAAADEDDQEAEIDDLDEAGPGLPPPASVCRTDPRTLLILAALHAGQAPTARAVAAAPATSDRGRVCIGLVRLILRRFAYPLLCMMVLLQRLQRQHIIRVILVRVRLFTVLTRLRRRTI